jgi:hypothetical protein
VGCILARSTYADKLLASNDTHTCTSSCIGVCTMHAHQLVAVAEKVKTARRPALWHTRCICCSTRLHTNHTTRERGWRDVVGAVVGHSSQWVQHQLQTS